MEVTAPLLEEVEGAAEVGFGSVVDEHPDRITRAAPVALRARREYLGIPSI